jgi:glucose/mannose transport system substrate-binding protein
LQVVANSVIIPALKSCVVGQPKKEDHSMVRKEKRSSCLVFFLLVSMLLTACSSSVPTTGETSAFSPAPALGSLSASGSETSPTVEKGKNRLEIFSWWTNAGEVDGLNALYDVYKERNPGVEIINATVAGGAGSNAKVELATRMEGGQPPDSFQVHAGQELIGTWVLAGKMEPVTQLFRDEGWDRVMPRLLLEQIAYNGEIYSVPVNIHRSNMLWYNKQIFEDNNLAPPQTLEEFFQVAETLQAHGITPLSVGGKDGFEVPHLFESVLLASFGPQDYQSLFQSGGTAWADARMAQAIQTLHRMLEYSNSDRASLSWSDAAQRVLDGSAAMTIMGDWVKGYFISKEAEPDVELGWAAAPNTDSVFIWLSDSFGLPRGAPHRENAIAWLKVCGSREGQDAFNPKKGSIPARTDADKGLYDAYLQWSIDQFASNRLAPSVVHGAAANESFMAAFNNALNVFSTDLDQQALNESLHHAFGELSR